MPETPPPKISSPGSATNSDKMRPKTPAVHSPSETSQNPANQSQTQSSPTASSSFSSSGSGTQQFCLRWNNYQSNLTSVFDQLLQNESFVDVTLACDGQSIKAHKMVLSACSPYFQALFFDNPCQHPIIIMRDVKWPELKAVVEFMYKGEINVSQEQIGPLLKVAEMLKIRGLADVNGDQDPNVANPSTSTSGTEVAAKKARVTRDWELNSADSQAVQANRNRKRRWPSADNAIPDSPLGGMGVSGGPPTPDINNDLPSPVAAASNAPQMPHPPSTPNTMPSFSLPTPLETMGLSTLGMSHADDMEIKPGIAEMIREEERAKLMENSHAWLGASTSSIADSYQYQLQSMWQKCWNTNQNLMHHLRFRERGPLKSWRPETMAEAIFSVLKEGLSLSQAARKYDIPYPTFVLYANRVHNMLGPSIDGGTDLRPKGRGRPQRILLGIWPDEHIKGVIKTVVFRDAKELKEEGMQLSYGRHSPVFPFQEGSLNYAGAPCTNGLPPQPNVSVSDSMSPEATAAAVAAVAHGIRQQMQMAAAVHHPDAASNLFNLPAHLHSNNGGITLPKQNSPASSVQANTNQHNQHNQQRHASPSIPGLPNPAALGLPGLPGMHFVSGLNPNTSQAAAAVSSASYSSNINNHHTTVAPAHMALNTSASNAPSNISRNDSPPESAHDLRMNSPEESPLNSPLDMPLEPAVNLAVGVSGMAYKPSRGYSSPRPEHLFQEDIADLVGNTSRNCPPNMNTFKEPPPGIKIEPMAECRSE